MSSGQSRIIVGNNSGQETNSARVTLKFGTVTAVTRVEHCTIVNIPTIFQISNQQSFFLRRHETNEIECPDELGVFQCYQGTYEVITVSGQNSGISFPALNNNNNSNQRFVRASIFNPPRIPLPVTIATRSQGGYSSMGFAGAASNALSNQFRRDLVQQGGGRRRLHQADANGDPDWIQEKAKMLTLYLKLGEWSRGGKIVEHKINGITEIPVSFDIWELDDVEKMNKKVTEAIKGNSDLEAWQAASFNIHRPTLSKIVECAEMKADGWSFWNNEKIRQRKYWVVPEKAEKQKLEKSISDDSDDDSEFEMKSCLRGNKRSANSGSDVLKKMSKFKHTIDKQQLARMKAAIDSNNDNEEKLKGLVKSIENTFECNYCLKVMNCPVVCKNCNALVGCAKCVRDEEAAEGIADEIVVKPSGQWNCPKCDYKSFNWEMALFKFKVNVDVFYEQHFENWR